MDMSERKGFAKGVEALRAALIERFERPGIGAGSFEGFEIAHLIRGVEVKPRDQKPDNAAAQTP